MTKMPPYIPVLPNSKGISLNMSYNSISQLETSKKTTSNFEKISQLHLSHNQIKEVRSEDFPPHLTQLSLDSNQLTVIGTEMIQRMEGLDLMKLGNNEYECSCESKALFYFVKEYRDYIEVREVKNFF